MDINYDDIYDMMEDDDFQVFDKANELTKKNTNLELNYVNQQNSVKSDENEIVLLPIKTKKGFVQRTQSMNIEIVHKTSKKDDSVIAKETSPKNENVITTVNLIAEREEEIKTQKLKIGALCAALLEKPEEKVKNLHFLLNMLEYRNKSGHVNFYLTRKLVMLSLAEIFKDLLPEYRVGIIDTKKQKVKKDTLGRTHFENSLLDAYKLYLNKLENMTTILKKEKKTSSKQNYHLAEIAVQCLCKVLLAHSYFNYNMNIAQLLVCLLNSNNITVRQTVLNCFIMLFKSDKRFDLTRHILRHINHLVKKRESDVFPEVINCLLYLPIKDVNLDSEKDLEIKQKNLENQKSRAINLSKTERKKKRKIADLEKELVEIKAEENKQTKHTKLVDVTKLVFTIYFRCLKTYSGTRLLSGILEGLAKFAHIINIEYFCDLVEVLHTLLAEYDLGYREQIHCIKTIFIILTGQGEVLNIDPARFYTHLYKNMLKVHAGKNYDDIGSIIETLDIVLIKRRKTITQHRFLAFIKRLMTMCLQVLPNAGLGLMGIVRMSMLLSSQPEILLDTESVVGSGSFNSMVEEPEFSNANCTHLFEVTMLQKHYHPILRKYATHIGSGVPSTGHGSLNVELGKRNPIQLYMDYDSTNIAFNPAVPTPKCCDVKTKPGIYVFNDSKIDDYCNYFKNKNYKSSVNNSINFYENFPINSKIV